uniref:prephenate dehydratase n=1 Tax=Flavobacterium sp. TaxID=239 RepID=UPI00404B6E86
MNHKIAIQGIKGSFHHQVALDYFGSTILVNECMSFDSLVESVLKNKSKLAVMAIENSIAGSIIPNYALIDNNNLKIIGEYYLSVHHNFMTLKGQNLHDITEVHSHPMAILQCKEFFKNHPHIKLVEDKDTAETAKRIIDNNLKGIGAIASKTAAELYNLEILASEIQTINNNQTRFVIVANHQEEIHKSKINKASLKFELQHQSGSLATVLNVMSDCKLNLTKIQSLPIIETPFQYAFFVDITFDAYKDYEKGKQLLEIMTTNFKVLGEYKNNKL